MADGHAGRCPPGTAPWWGGVTVAVVTAVHGGLALRGLVGNRRGYQLDGSWSQQVVGYGVLTALLVACAVFLVRNRPVPTWLVRTGIPLVLGAAVITSADLPASAIATSAHWSVLVTGWFGVLLLHGRLHQLLAFLVGYGLLTAAVVANAGVPDRVTTAGIVTVLLAASAQQAGFSILVTILRRGAERAEQAARGRALLEADRIAAGLVHADQRRRSTDLAAAVIPLLTGIADGDLDPADPAVAGACASEASRMRRSFVEAEHGSDAVLQDLRAGLDLAQRRGVRVLVAVRGEPVRLPDDVRRAALDPVLAALATARRDARVTVVHRPRELRLGVVGDGPALPDGTRHPAVDVDVHLRDERRWVVVRAAVPDRPARTGYRSSRSTSPS